MIIHSPEEDVLSGRQNRILLFFVIFLVLMVLPFKAYPSWYFESPDDSKMTNRYNVGLISVAINKITNYPHMSYGGGHIYHAYFDGNSWYYETVDYSRFEGPLTARPLNTSIAVDSIGKVHIVYGGFVNRDGGIYGEVRYATNSSGEWEISTLESYLGSINNYYSMAPSLAIDSSDKVHISYNSKTSYSGPVKLQYATNSSGSMVLSTIGTSTSAYIGFSYIAVDTKDRAYISYQTTSGDPRLATNASGSWVIYGVPYAGRLAIDSSDKLHISYGSGNIYYATNASGSWTTNNVAHGNGTSSIAIDSDDKVHIAYGDGLINKYATNATGVWVDSSVASLLGSSINITPSIAVDSGNKAHIVFYTNPLSSTTDVKYANNTSGAWALSTADSGGLDVDYLSIALDSNNKSHISYYEAAHGTLKYTTDMSGLWITSVIDSVGSENMLGYPKKRSSIAIDSNGNIHISYIGASYHLKYANNTSGSWVSTIVDPAGENGEYSSIAIDSNNKVHISYRDRTNTALKYVTNTSGSWVKSTIDGDGYRSSIAVDSNDKVHISYDREWETGVRYATNASGSWVKTIIAPNGSNSSIAIDYFNKIHIASQYSVSYTPYIQYITNTSGAWVTSPVSVTRGWIPSIALDSYGSAHISFCDDSNNELKYASNKSGSWVVSTVELTGGFYSSIAIDFNDNVHIGYRGSISDLRYATLEDNCIGCPPISNFPYSESFESGWGVWGPVEGEGFNWTRFKGSTSSSGTGPSDGEEGGYYLYTEASSPNYPGKWAEIAATFDFSTVTAPQLGFSYHMYGAAMGNLYMDVYDGLNYHALGSVSGQQHSSHSEPWSHIFMDLSPYAGMSNVKIIFGGITGNGYTSDMAIDRIEVFDNNMQGHYYCDDDEDGYVDSTSDGDCAGYGCLLTECQLTAGNDCDDENPAVYLLAYWHPDNDGDGYGNPEISLQQCGQPQGFVLDNTDYDDNDANIYPGGPPVRIGGTSPSYYPSLQAAYNAASEGDVLQVQAMSFIENLLINLNKEVAIQGGYNGSYTSQSGKTTIQGDMSVTSGKLRVENFVLQ